MDDKAALRICGGLALLTLGLQIAFRPIVGELGYNPADVDHAKGDVLTQMHATMPRSLFASVQGLLAPALALLSSLGWLILFRDAGSLARTGVRLWQFGMLLVILQDSIELYADATLPGAYVAADVTAGQQLLDLGANYSIVIDALTYAGHLASAIGAAMFGLALVRRPGAWKILGAYAIVAAIVSITADAMRLVLADPPPVLIFVAVAPFVLWTVILGVIMLLWSCPRKPIST